MKLNKFFFLIVISFSFGNILNNYNSIYYLANNSKSHSLAGVHFLSDNISGVFSHPLSKNTMKGDTYFSYLNQFSNSINIMQFGYCIINNKKNNISVGFISRKINDLNNTTESWHPLNDMDEPDFNEIDYDNINDLKYNNFGFLLSYNQYIKEKIINIKLKPYYESIQTMNSFGLDFDFNLFVKLKNEINLILGINDFVSYKKWNNDLIEKNKLNYFVSTSVILDNIELFIEANYLYNEKIGLQYKFDNILVFRFGSNASQDFYCGIGLNSDFAQLNYAYIPTNNYLGNINQLNLTFKLNGLKEFKEKLKP